MKIFGKIVLSVLAAAVITFAGFVGSVLVMLTAENIFIMVLVPVTAVIVLLFVIDCIWRLLRTKTRCIIFAALMSAVVLAAIGNGAYRAYDKRIPTVNQEVDLRQYKPFAENTKAVKLDEPSTLTLTAGLPRLDGATALYPLYAAFAQAVYPEGEYNPYSNGYVACGKTDEAYATLIKGGADIIFAAGPSKEQRQLAADCGVELKLTPIGREAFVFFVNAKNPVNELSVDDIRSIYAGTSTNWKEFGGKDKQIRAFQRPTGSGSQTALINLMDGAELMTPPQEDVAAGMGGMIKSVTAYKNYDNAIGYSFLFYASEMAADKKIKLLELNGVAPTRENVANGTYPYSSEFYAVTAGSENPDVDRFIEWMLSEQGQYLVEKTGYTPLNKQ